MFGACLHRRTHGAPRRAARWLFPALIALFLAAQAAAAQEPLTLARAVDLALQNDVSAKLAALAFEEAMLNYERSIADNLLGGSEQSRRQAENARRSAVLGYENAQYDLVSSTIERYVGVLRARINLEIAQKQLQIAQLDFVATERRVALGTATELDLMNASSDLTNAELELASAESSLLTATQDLAFSLGFDPDSLPELDPEIPVLPFEYDLELAIAKAIERNSNVASARSALENAELELELARAEGAAPLDLRSLEISLERARIQLDQQLQSVERDVASRYENLIRTRESLKSSETSLMSQERRFAAIKEQHRAGLRSDRELLQAEVNLARERSTRLQSVSGYLRDVVTFQRLIGEPPGIGSAFQLGGAADGNE